MSKIDTDTLKSQTDLLALTERDTELKHVANTEGGEFAGPCPFCGGRDRFRVQPHRFGGGRWLCRQCTAGKWQDVIAYVMRREVCDFQRACELLGAADSLPTRTRKAIPPPTPSPIGSELNQSAAREVMDVCEHGLRSQQGERARAWLHGRGLNDDTLHHWHIGYNPGGYKEWRNIAGLSVPCGVVIPCEVSGVVWYLKTRRASGLPKYQQIKGSRPALFGADTLRGQSVAVLCEGEFDALLLWQEAGGLAGVATLGSASGRLDVGAWGAYLLPISRLLIAYDLDDSGEHGAQSLAGLTHRARLASVPQLREEDKDLTDYYKAGGNLYEWLARELAHHRITNIGNDTPSPDSPPTWLTDSLSELGLTVTGRDGRRLTVDHALTPDAELSVTFEAMEANPTPENVRRYSIAAIRAGLPCGDHHDPAAGWRAFADKYDPLLPIVRISITDNQAVTDKP